MTSLPERLRSLVARGHSYPESYSELVTEAADELDRQAATIMRLQAGITAMRRRGEIALDAREPVSRVAEDVIEALAPDEVVVSPEVDAARWYDDAPCRCVYPDKCACRRRDPLDAPMLVSDLVPPGVVEVRVGDKIVCKIIGIGP